MIEAPVQIADEYVRTYLWEHNLVAIDEGNLKKLMREWQGLTEQEHANIAVEVGCASADWVFYGAAVERALKEKNS